ncbi:MAG: DegV family protein [Erysipelotrichaceae bacterium]|nr:DegV family protein [Erysipelotrichaceae bacterium]
MSVKVIVDSASDINIADAKEMGVTVVPLKTYFGDEEYLDGVTLDANGFYEKLAIFGEKPRTSQISPYDFSLVFKEELNKGNEVICIDLSKLLSGCYQSACIAKQDLESESIYPVDSKSASVGEIIMVQLALKLAEEGKTGKEISDILNSKADDLKVVILLESLDYLTSGGRINASAAQTNLNGVRPIVSIEDGKVVMKGKARGIKSGYELLNQIVEECGGIDFNLPFALGYSGLSDKMVIKYREEYKNLFNTNNAKDVKYFQMGCTIGSHLGPNAVAVAFFAKNNN